MIRFTNGVPKAIWYSQHANGSAYTFSAAHKDVSGKRVSLTSHVSRFLLISLTCFSAHCLRRQWLPRSVPHSRHTRSYDP